METKDIILELRTKNGLSQDELAEKVFVTRQAVSRWENGETIPNTETLKLLSELLTFLLIHFLAHRDNLYARVAECLLMTVISVTKKTAHLTKTIADGATPTANTLLTFLRNTKNSVVRKSSKNLKSNLFTN